MTATSLGIGKATAAPQAASRMSQLRKLSRLVSHLPSGHRNQIATRGLRPPRFEERQRRHPSAQCSGADHSLFGDPTGGLIGLIVMLAMEGWIPIPIGIGIGAHVALCIAYHNVTVELATNGFNTPLPLAFEKLDFWGH